MFDTESTQTAAVNSTEAKEFDTEISQTSAANSTEAKEFDEFGNVIVKKRVYTVKELAAMQAVYPSNLVFTGEDIKHGGSILFLLGNLSSLF